MNTTQLLPGLPTGITSRLIPVNDLDIHVLEVSPPSLNESAVKPPLIILLHGFPELAYSWRKIMVPLAANGFFVVAPDQRGYGRTRERGQLVRKIKYEEDLAPYRILNMVNDIVALVYTLGYTSVAAVVGHDAGSFVAGNCALIRPDLFKSVAMLSVPYQGPPAHNSAHDANTQTPLQLLDRSLATLDPPRKYYMNYYSTPTAADDMNLPKEGLHTFLRTYYHVKSADWKGNQVHPLKDFSPATFAPLPYYYIMPLAETMPGCLASDAPSAEEVARNEWLPDQELANYVSQYAGTGFQGGLNGYRCITDPRWTKDLQVFAGKKIQIPAMFIAGVQDWAPFHLPGLMEKMRKEACRDMKEENVVFVNGAGHWIQQEQPEAVLAHILRFLNTEGLLPTD